MSDTSRTGGAGDLDARLAEEFRQQVLPLCDRWVHQVQAAAGSLHLPDEQRHDQPGWLSALSVQALHAAGAAISAAELAFPVPEDCAWWHAPETLPDGTVIRFFARQAWLGLEAASHQAELSFLAAYAIEPDALWQLRVLADGVPMERVAAETAESGVVRLRFRRLDVRPGRVRIDLISPRAQVVKEVHPDAADTRYLSLAVSCPQWHGEALAMPL